MQSIERKIEELKNLSSHDDVSTLLSGIESAILLIESLADENASVWQMIDEQRLSDVENHAKLIRQELNRKIEETFNLMSNKVVKA